MLTVSWGTMTVAFHRSVVVCAVHTHAVTCAAAPRLTARNSDDVLIQTTESEVTFFSRKYVRYCGVENQYLRIFRLFKSHSKLEPDF